MRQFQHSFRLLKYSGMHKQTCGTLDSPPSFQPNSYTSFTRLAETTPASWPWTTTSKALSLEGFSTKWNHLNTSFNLNISLKPWKARGRLSLYPMWPSLLHSPSTYGTRAREEQQNEPLRANKLIYTTVLVRAQPPYLSQSMKNKPERKVLWIHKKNVPLHYTPANFQPYYYEAELKPYGHRRHRPNLSCISRINLVLLDKSETQYRSRAAWALDGGYAEGDNKTILTDMVKNCPNYRRGYLGLRPVEAFQTHVPPTTTMLTILSTRQHWGLA